MQIKPDSKLKGLFLRALMERHNSMRRGIHVSDLVYCLREAYFRKVEPAEPTVKQLGFFVDGARRHKVLQELLGVESEVEVEKYGVVGHVDILLDAPVEIKTTRARKALPDHYFRQLGFYAVMLDVPRGYLIVQRLNGDSPWEFYRVEWSKEEFQLLDQELKHRANLLRAALNFHDFHRLPRVEGDTAWKCQHCLYRQKCLGGIHV